MKFYVIYRTMSFPVTFVTANPGFKVMVHFGDKVTMGH